MLNGQTKHEMSDNPFQDRFDALTVYVAPSEISPEAGEGLFAKRRISEGELVCLFNGIRMSKLGRTCKVVRPDSDEWSDYRLTLGTNI